SSLSRTAACERRSRRTPNWPAASPPSPAPSPSRSWPTRSARRSSSRQRRLADAGADGDAAAFATWLADAGRSPHRVAAYRRDAVVLGLLYFAGLKASEAIGLDLGDIGADLGWLTADRAGPHERRLPTVAALEHALVRWVDGRGRARLGPTTAAVLVNRRGQ